MRPSLGFRMAGAGPLRLSSGCSSSPEVFLAATAATYHLNFGIRCLDVIKTLGSTLSKRRRINLGRAMYHAAEQLAFRKPVPLSREKASRRAS